MSNYKPSFQIREIVLNVLNRPGHYVNTLFRTDGITQDSSIKQLLANFFRFEKYNFCVMTEREEELSELSLHFRERVDEFLEHLRQEHSGRPFESLIGACSGCPPSRCIGATLQILKELMESYGNLFRAQCLSQDSNYESCLELLSNYNNFLTFIVVIEKYIPEISEIISSLDHGEFPPSLWKYLHRLYVDNIISPLMPTILTGLKEKIWELRVSVINNREVGTEDIYNVRSVVAMLVEANLDELSVHIIQSSAASLGSFVKQLENQLLSQSDVLYKSYPPSPKDFHLLSSLLFPSSEKIVTDYIVSTFGVPEVPELVTAQHIRDFETEKYLVDLGIELL